MDHPRSAILCFTLAHTVTGWSADLGRESTMRARACRRQLHVSKVTCFSTGGDSRSSGNSTLPTGWIQTEEHVQRFGGAGEPRPDLRPEDVPTLLMTALSLNDDPYPNAGLESMWEFAAGATQHIFKHNMTDFIESAYQTADEFPTSFYGAAFYGQYWEMETDINRVGGEQGWIATQVMKTVISDGRVRRWQWELRKNKRPPCLGCWKVETIASSDRKGNFEPE